MAGLLEVRGLSCGYGSGPVVRDLDLQVEAGEVVALLGPNGAGKTTTLMTISGALPSHGGVVLWKGERMMKPLHARARSRLAFVPEERSVFMGLSVRDNLRVGGVSPDDVFALFPELEPRLRVQAGLLSGGEQQMLTLARALARKPDLLLADELSLGLAPLVVQRLLRAVRDAADRGLGVLLVEQQIGRALDLADRVYVMRHGRVAMSAAAAEARAHIFDIAAVYLPGDAVPDDASPEGGPDGARPAAP